MIAAAAQWPREGIPEEPRGWLVHVAARRVTDQVRNESARRRREALVVSLIPPEDQIALPVDLDRGRSRTTRSRSFSCAVTRRSPRPRRSRSRCAPSADSRPRRSRERSSCPRRRWRSASAARSRPSRRPVLGSRCRPSTAERGERLARVLHVLYLIFNEGYTRAPVRSSTEQTSRRRPFASRAWFTHSSPNDQPRSPGCSR